MFRLWESVIEPVLLAVQPSSVVEIGCDEGRGTELLLQYAVGAGVVVHAIDPRPGFDVDGWKQMYGDHFQFHRVLSLEALPLIGRPDVALIDGDHNWHTVLSELSALEDATAEVEDALFPVVILHDVGWPYGRRDLYYDPTTIPADRRRPFVTRGLVPGESDPVPDGGVNSDLFNATVEGGPRNGVLTAVEDFVSRSSHDLRLITLPGMFGLAILYPAGLIERNLEFAALTRSLDPSDHLRGMLEVVEECRVAAELQVGEISRHLDRSLHRAQRRRRRMARKLASFKAEVDRLKGARSIRSGRIARGAGRALRRTRRVVGRHIRRPWGSTTK
jgi:hypothetical protein